LRAHSAVESLIETLQAVANGILKHN
jgi:hypothetical protein